MTKVFSTPVAELDPMARRRELLAFRAPETASRRKVLSGDDIVLRFDAGKAIGSLRLVGFHDHDYQPLQYMKIINARTS